MNFNIELSGRARTNLKRFRKRDQQIVVDAMDAQLTSEPDRPTRNRKPLEENPLAPWELRVGEFRVFYDVALEESLVVVLAIGRKIHNRLYIDGEEIEL